MKKQKILNNILNSYKENSIFIDHMNIVLMIETAKIGVFCIIYVLSNDN